MSSSRALSCSVSKCHDRCVCVLPPRYGAVTSVENRAVVSEFLQRLIFGEGFAGASSPPALRGLPIVHFEVHSARTAELMIDLLYLTKVGP